MAAARSPRASRMAAFDATAAWCAYGFRRVEAGHHGLGQPELTELQGRAHQRRDLPSLPPPRIRGRHGRAQLDKERPRSIAFAAEQVGRARSRPAPEGRPARSTPGPLPRSSQASRRPPASPAVSRRRRRTSVARPERTPIHTTRGPARAPAPHPTPQHAPRGRRRRRARTSGDTPRGPGDHGPPRTQPLLQDLEPGARPAPHRHLLAEVAGRMPRPDRVAGRDGQLQRLLHLVEAALIAQHRADKAADGQEVPAERHGVRRPWIRNPRRDRFGAAQGREALLESTFRGQHEAEPDQSVGKHPRWSEPLEEIDDLVGVGPTSSIANVAEGRGQRPDDVGRREDITSGAEPGQGLLVAPRWHRGCAQRSSRPGRRAAVPRVGQGDPPARARAPAPASRALPRHRARAPAPRRAAGSAERELRAPTTALRRRSARARPSAVE